MQPSQRKAAECPEDLYRLMKAVEYPEVWVVTPSGMVGRLHDQVGGTVVLVVKVLDVTHSKVWVVTTTLPAWQDNFTTKFEGRWCWL